MENKSIIISFSKSSRAFILSVLAIITPFYLSEYINIFDISIVIVFSIIFSTLIIYLFPLIRLKNNSKMFLISCLLALAMFLNYLFMNYCIFILSLMLGSISLSGRDISPNQPIEQYAISSYEIEIKSRNIAFSFYNFLSYSSSIISSIFLFLYVDVDYRTIFFVLFIVAVLQFILYLFIKFPDNKKIRAKGLNANTRNHVKSLSVLFSIDALAGGMVTVSMISLWFKFVYNISLSTAGFIFIFVNVITTISILLSSVISGRIGLIRTMVYTHSISNIFLILVPVIHSLILSELFLYLRQTTSQMDVPARDTLVNTIIDENYRVKSNTIFSAVRNGSQIPGPGIVGYMLYIFPPFMFFAAGTLKLSYDIMFYIKYRKIKI
ncbi:MAG: MFS transporter [Ferroplasma sp.]